MAGAAQVTVSTAVPGMITRRDVKKFFRYTDVFGQPYHLEASVMAVYLEEKNGCVVVADVVEAVRVQWGDLLGLPGRKDASSEESYAFFKSPPNESLLAGGTELLENEILYENDGSGSAPLYLTISEPAWIKLVKKSKDGVLQTSRRYKATLLGNRLKAEVLDQKAQDFSCDLIKIERYFIEDGSRRFPMDVLAGGFLSYTFHDAGSKKNPRKIVVADDTYFDSQCPLSDSRSLTSDLMFDPDHRPFLDGTYVHHFKRIRATPSPKALLNSWNDTTDIALMENLLLVNSHFRCIKKMAESASVIEVRSMVSRVLHAAAETYNMMSGAASEHQLHGDATMSEISVAARGTKQVLNDVDASWEGTRKGEGSLLEGTQPTRAQAGEHTGHLPASEGNEDEKQPLGAELEVVEEMEVTAVILTGAPKWNFVKVSSKIDLAVCHSAPGPRSDATLVTLEVKIMDAVDEKASLFQAYAESRAIMELRRPAGRGRLAAGGSTIRAFFVLTNGIKWRFFMLEAVQGERGEVEVKGVENNRCPVVLEFDEDGWPVNGEEVFGSLLEMVERGAGSSPRASGEQHDAVTLSHDG